MDHPCKVLKQSTHQLQRKPGNNYQTSNHLGVTQQADLQNLEFPEAPNFSSHRNQPENLSDQNQDILIVFMVNP